MTISETDGGTCSGKAGSKMGSLGNPLWLGRQNLKSLDEIQTIEVDPVSRERRHKDHPELWTIPDGDAVTYLEGFERGMGIAGADGNFIGIPIKDEKLTVTGYTWKTYGDVEADSKQAANGLSKLGLTSGEDFIGFFSINNYQYDIGILAGYRLNFANVSLYDTLGEQAVEFINKETEVKVLFVQDIKHLKLLFKLDTPALQTVIIMEEVSGEVPKKDGITVMTWAEFMKSGEEGELVEVRPTGDDLATLNYTSGTTGNPKGVMLTHRQLLTSGIGSGLYTLCGKALTNDDVWFSYLPLAHIFERVAHILFMAYGAKWCYNGGNMANVVAELAIAKPTVFGAVPRVLNKLYDKINAGLNAPGFVAALKRMLIKLAMRRKRAYLKAGIVTKDTIWDRKLLKLLQDKLGGQVHTIACGAAPLNPEVRGFVRELMSVYFIEGYGQTENSAIGCATCFANYTEEDGCIGAPLPWTGIKLVDVPEMNYFAKDGKGEICFRGGNVMKGYYKMPEKTAETIDEDGWLHTGDIGMWSANGQLKIIDRKKNIFKLSQGEYVAPERLEGIYAKNPLVAQIFIHGDSNESTLVAVVVPEEVNFAAINKDKNELMKQINAVAKEGDQLKGFEMIRGVHIETELFSVENGLLTPTQKAKRPQLLAKYKTHLDALYAAMKK